MATRGSFVPESAHFPTSNFAASSVINGRPVLWFDATTSETAYWTVVAPQGITGTSTIVISYLMASATTGGVAVDVAVEAVTSGDAVDLDAGTSFDAVNAASDAAVPGTAGFMEQITVTLTNADSIQPADYVRISIARDVADAADTATGDWGLILAEFRDAA